MLSKETKPEGENDPLSEAMRRTVEIVRERERQFPHWHSFIVELATPEEEAALQRADAWLAAGNVAPDAYTTSSDPAGFTWAVYFKEKADFEKFMQDVQPPA